MSCILARTRASAPRVSLVPCAPPTGRGAILLPTPVGRDSAPTPSAGHHRSGHRATRQQPSQSQPFAPDVYPSDPQRMQGRGSVSSALRSELRFWHHRQTSVQGSAGPPQQAQCPGRRSSRSTSVHRSATDAAAIACAEQPSTISGGMDRDARVASNSALRSLRDDSSSGVIALRGE